MGFSGDWANVVAPRSPRAMMLAVRRATGMTTSSESDAAEGGAVLLLRRRRGGGHGARRQRPVAVERRPVRHRELGRRIEHRRIDRLDLPVLDVEPLTEYVPRRR